MNSEVKTNSMKAWVLAARPKTLAGAATPVIMGGACAWMWLYGNTEAVTVAADMADAAAGCKDLAALTAKAFDWTSARAGTRSRGSGRNGPAHRGGLPPEP